MIINWRVLFKYFRDVEDFQERIARHKKHAVVCLRLFIILGEPFSEKSDSIKIWCYSAESFRCSLGSGGDIDSNFIQRSEPCWSVGRVPHGSDLVFCSKLQINAKHSKRSKNISRVSWSSSRWLFAKPFVGISYKEGWVFGFLLWHLFFNISFVFQFLFCFSSQAQEGLRLNHWIVQEITTFCTT